MKLTTEAVWCDGEASGLAGGDFRAVLDSDEDDAVRVEQLDGEWRQVGLLSVEHHGRLQLFNVPCIQTAPTGRQFSDRLLNLLELRLARSLRTGVARAEISLAPTLSRS